MNKLSELNWHSWNSAMDEAVSPKPKEVNTLSIRERIYQRYLYRLFFGSIQIEIPNDWDIEYFRWKLFVDGAIAITQKAGVTICGGFTVDKRNAWFSPISIRSQDQVDFGTKTPGKDCEIIYLETHSGIGLLGSPIPDLVELYAEKLANVDGAIDMNLLNSRSAYIFEADSAGEADTFKSMYTRIMSGRPAVFWRRKNSINDNKQPITTLPVKQNFVTDLLQDAKRTIVNEFLTCIGVNNANTDKKERLLTSEVSANDMELDCAVALWQANIDRCLEKVKKLYPDTDIKITMETKARHTMEEMMTMQQQMLGGGENEANRPNGSAENKKRA